MLLIIYTFFNDCVFLYKSPWGVSTKLKIFITYLSLTIFLPFDKFLHLKKINVMGYKIKGFNFRTLQFLFGEVFVRNEYYFHCNNQSPLIIDCGAEIGFTVFFFKYLFPDSKIWAFEPDPVSFSLLCENISNNNLTNVSLHNQAVSNKTGISAFYVDDKNPGNLRMSLIKGRLSKKSIKVPTIRLSQLITNKRIDYLKMDIEGNELVVLTDLNHKGILKNIIQLGVEYHHHISATDKSLLSRFLNLLEDNGFKYQLYASNFSTSLRHIFQDVIIWAYR